MLELCQGEESPFNGVLLTESEADTFKKLIKKYQLLEDGFKEYSMRCDG